MAFSLGEGKKGRITCDRLVTLLNVGLSDIMVRGCTIKTSTEYILIILRLYREGMNLLAMHSYK